MRHLSLVVFVSYYWLCQLATAFTFFVKSETATGRLTEESTRAAAVGEEDVAPDSDMTEGRRTDEWTRAVATQCCLQEECSNCTKLEKMIKSYLGELQLKDGELVELYTLVNRLKKENSSMKLLVEKFMPVNCPSSGHTFENAVAHVFSKYLPKDVKAARKDFFYDVWNQGSPKEKTEWKFLGCSFCTVHKWLKNSSRKRNDDTISIAAPSQVVFSFVVHEVKQYLDHEKHHWIDQAQPKEKFRIEEDSNPNKFCTLN